MDGSTNEFLRSPLAAIQSKVVTAISSALQGNGCRETELFNQFLLHGGCSQVPQLNLKTIRGLQPNTLVRFRGMVQNYAEGPPEQYVGAYKDGDVWRTNKYTDVPKDAIKNYRTEIKLWRRWLIYCIPVPGRNDWTEPSGPPMHLNTLGDKKPQRDKDAVMEDANELDLSDQAEESRRTKRMREGDTTTSSSSLQGVPAEGVSMSEVDIKSLSCLIYHPPDPRLKLHDVFEFVGIVALLDQVPRLHCLTHKKLSLSDFLPDPISLETNRHLVKPIREALLAYLTILLGYDDLAAQFMLLHLLSSVRERNDGVNMGKLALNLTFLTNENISVFKNRILSLLKNLLPFTYDLPLTAELLNAGPAKDNESKRLVSGALRLADGSHLTIDETQLNAGLLDSTGIKIASVLEPLLENQKTDFIFNNYGDGMPSDVQLLILSEKNSKSLPADLVLPFTPSSVDSPETPNAGTLADWRRYLATIRSSTHSTDHEMQEVLQSEIKACLIDLSLGIKHYDRLVSMARLVSLSFGEPILSRGHWEIAKELEWRRRQRLQERM